MATDIDECKGGNCVLKNACARYREHLRNQSPYPMTPYEKNCPMFKPWPFYGN